jgi:phosphoglycerate dehydrogenase-like enzyme
LDVLATPHAAGACNVFATKTAAAIAANIQRLAEQEPLQWLVNPA